MLIPLWKFCKFIFDAVATFVYGIIKYCQKQLQLNFGNCKKKKEEQMQKQMDHAEDGIQQKHFQCKRLRNPKGNFLNKSHTKAIVSPDGLKACNTLGHVSVFGRKGFSITPKYARQDHYPGTIIYYFEVTRRSFSSTQANFFVGLTKWSIAGSQFIGKKPDSYAIEYGYKQSCWIADEVHSFEWPNNGNQPAFNGRGDVLGCGLLMNPENKLTIFFTLNGILLGKPIPICPSVGCLFPKVKMWDASVEFNFGDNLAKPFKFDVDKCPGLVFQ